MDPDKNHNVDIFPSNFSSEDNLVDDVVGIEEMHSIPVISSWCGMLKMVIGILKEKVVGPPTPINPIPSYYTVFFWIVYFDYGDQYGHIYGALKISPEI